MTVATLRLRGGRPIGRFVPDSKIIVKSTSVTYDAIDLIAYDVMMVKSVPLSTENLPASRRLSTGKMETDL
jgi:hypothetical protein